MFVKTQTQILSLDKALSGKHVSFYGLYTLHGTGTGNDGFLYYAMYCTHYTGTGTRICLTSLTRAKPKDKMEFPA